LLKAFQKTSQGVTPTVNRRFRAKVGWKALIERGGLLHHDTLATLLMNRAEGVRSLLFV
jgi:hypothetical protein